MNETKKIQDSKMIARQLFQLKLQKKRLINILFEQNLLENTQNCTNTSTFTKFTFRMMIICISRIRNDPCASIIFITTFSFGRFDDFQQRIRHFYQTFRFTLNGKRSITKQISYFFFHLCAFNQNVSKYVIFMKCSLVETS